MRPGSRMRALLHGRVFSRQAKGIPAHGMQHLKTAHPFVAGNHITNGVVAHMAHVDFARWIRKHLQHIVFFPSWHVGHPIGLLLLPALLPFALNGLEIVAVVHGVFCFLHIDGLVIDQDSSGG